MFKLKYILQFGGRAGAGESSGTSAASGTRTGTAKENTASRQTGKQVSVGRSTGKTSQKTAGKTVTAGSQKSTSATRQKARTTGSTVNRGTTATTGTTGTRQRTNQSGTQVGGASGTASTSATAAGNLSQVLSSLDLGTQEQLTELISAIGSPQEAALLQNILQDRAISADADLAGSTSAIIASARRSGERGIGAQETALAKSAGSTQNSLVAQIGLEAQVDLETELAALQSSLDTQNRGIATGELQAAFDSSLGGTVNLANILKGATQTTEQTTAQQNNQQQQNNQITNQATTSIGDVISSQTTKQNQVNASTQVVDQTTASTASTQASQQNQQIVDVLQSILGTSSTVDISTILNDLIATSERNRTINESAQSSGNTKGQQASAGISFAV